MVKKIIAALFLSFSSLFAGEFTASVSSTQMNLNEGFTLSLTLQDTSPKDAPKLSALNEHFLIQSEQYLTNTSILNGKASSSITWSLSLFPKIEGVLTIPSIPIETAEGLLTTKPISLNVTKSLGQDSKGLNLITKVSNPSPYKNEPFVYTAILTSKMPLYNIQTEKLQLKDAIVELLEQPKLEERVIEGVMQSVVEFTYLITPLKAGSLTIPAIPMQGAIPQKRKAQFSPFDRMKPFVLMTEEIGIDVQPAIPEVSPWLPARALTLEEEWPNNQLLREGEPFFRSFLIKAEGLKASQLPHLENLQNQNTAFKIYADKPEEQEKVVQGALHSTRKEQYTLIPQNAGTIVLPEISIPWWDSEEKVLKTSSIPARTVQILPALKTAMIPPPPPAVEAPKPSENSPPFLLYSLMGILVFLFLAALLWAFALQRKLTQVKGVKKKKKEKLPDLNPT